MKLDVAFARGPLHLEEEGGSRSGAVVRFAGIVRPIEDGVEIAGLDYAAYEPMARMVAAEIVESLARGHPIHRVRFRHRLGFVPVGEAAILLEVSSKHRAEAFAVCSKFMDRLKQEIPIWKVGSIARKSE